MSQEEILRYYNQIVGRLIRRFIKRQWDNISTYCTQYQNKIAERFSKPLLDIVWSLFKAQYLFQKHLDNHSHLTKISKVDALVLINKTKQNKKKLYNGKQFYIFNQRCISTFFFLRSKLRKCYRKKKGGAKNSSGYKYCSKLQHCSTLDSYLPH